MSSGYAFQKAERRHTALTERATSLTTRILTRIRNCVGVQLDLGPQKLRGSEDCGRQVPAIAAASTTRRAVAVLVVSRTWGGRGRARDVVQDDLARHGCDLQQPREPPHLGQPVLEYDAVPAMALDGTVEQCALASAARYFAMFAQSPHGRPAS